MGRVSKKAKPSASMRKTKGRLHSKQKQLQVDTYTLKGLSKQYQLFGKTKGQVLHAKGKQEIKEALEKVMETIESMMELVQEIDKTTEVTDKALAKLYEFTQKHEQNKIFKPTKSSPLWS